MFSLKKYLEFNLLKKYLEFNLLRKFFKRIFGIQSLNFLRDFDSEEDNTYDLIEILSSKN